MIEPTDKFIQYFVVAWRFLAIGVGAVWLWRFYMRNSALGFKQFREPVVCFHPVNGSDLFQSDAFREQLASIGLRTLGKVCGINSGSNNGKVSHKRQHRRRDISIEDSLKSESRIKDNRAVEGGRKV